MKQVIILTPEDGAKGFALTGIRQWCLEAEDLWAVLKKVMNDPEVGVAAVDARLLTEGDVKRMHELAEHWTGVLVTLPAPAREKRVAGDELQRLVQRALGYHVRLETD
ncbi:MAG: ATPase [Desulfuromonas sp.]|nr:MAG: ATPase [Desulfuromonas sp.]